MDRSVKIRFEIVDDVTKPSQGIANSLKRVESQIRDQADTTKKAVAKTSSGLDSFGKKLIATYLSAEAAKKAIAFFTDALKEFDKQSKGTGLKTLQNNFGQLQVEIGSVLYPELIKFNKWFNENKTTITSYAQGITKLLLGVGKIIGGTFDTIASALVSLVNADLAILTSLVRGAMWLVNKMVSVTLLPKSFKKSVNDAYEDMAATQEMFVRAAELSAKDTKKAFKTIEQGARDVKLAIDEMAAGKVNLSGVKYVSDAQRKALDDLKKALSSYKDWEKSTIVTAADNLRKLTMSASAYNIYQNRIMYTKIKHEASQKLKEITELQKKAHGKRNEDLQLNLDSYKKFTAMYLMYAKSAEEELKKAHEKAKLEEARTLDAAQEEMYKTALDMSLEYRSTDIESLNRYYDEMYLIYRMRGDDITKLEAQQIKDRNRINSELRTEFKSNKSGSTESKANEALQEEVDRRKSILIDMTESEMFSVDELSSYMIGIDEYTAEQRKAIDQDLLNAKMENMSKTVSMYADMGKAIIDIGSNIVQIQLNNLAKETEARTEAVNKAFDIDSKYTKNTGKLSKEKQKALQKIQDESLAKEKELKNKEKGFAIGSALISGAEATMSMWANAMKLPFPANMALGGIMTGLIVALTGTQIGMIASQKFAGGGVAKGPESGDMVNAQLNGGEMVLTKAQQYNLWANANSRNNAGLNIEGDTYVVSGNLDQNAVKQIRDMKEERMALLRSDIKELSYRRQLQFS